MALIGLLVSVRENGGEPNRGSRALSFVEIFDLLAKRAKASDSAEAAAKEREILGIIKSLQAR